MYAINRIQFSTFVVELCFQNEPGGITQIISEWYGVPNHGLSRVACECS